MAASNTDRLHLFGVRHHGPGSARAVLAALDAADPAIVLIEGPPDADDMIAFAASAAMTPPVALLVHVRDDPANASFFPFAVFSPEWQAMRWALARQRPVRFIDLPMSIRLAERKQPVVKTPVADGAPPDAAVETPTDQASGQREGKQEEGKPQGQPEGEPGPAQDPESDLDPDAEPDPADDEFRRIRRDPLAYLAALAGYDDGEAWWNALVEQGAHGPEIFAALETAMTALRERLDQQPCQPPAEAETEQRREAHMRLAAAEALKETEGPVAVVCGAWHVPALRRPAAAKDDRAVLKGLATVKVTATWIPWTETRLAAGSGYGAGVLSPGWYAHLWQELQRDKLQPHKPQPETTALAATAFATRWQARVAALLRKNGRPASTASVIEAARLAISLAALRDLALPGLDEMREATLATLCEGEPAPFRLIESQLVIGQGVGEIDDAVPQMPLAADLARWQRRLKLKPEALDADISLDLRSDAGLAKSQLLHRLALIHVPWGTPLGTGQSRGTFRENWRLRWDPEFSVRLAEALVHGTTVEQAAGNAAVAEAERAASLDTVSAIVRGCLDAGLDAAADRTITLLQQQSAAATDIASLAGAVPPLADILRYGTARAMPVQALRLLVTSLTEAVCAGLVYACRNLQAEPAQDLRTKLGKLDVAMTLVDDAGLSDGWRRALRLVADDAPSHPLLRGQATRMLYDQGILAADAAARHLSRALSPAVPALEAGDWLDGFLGESGQVLLHDVSLRRIIDGWLVVIGEEEFTNLLPVLRRAFSSFDLSERRRLLDELAKTPPPAAAIETPVPGSPALQPETDAPGFAAALPLLLTILGADVAALEETSP
jgi:hypothetical protein